MKLLDLFQELTIHPKNAEELKGLILQLAVQGKLTKKWRTANPLATSPLSRGDAEGRGVLPASILLQKIATEKAELIKAKKLKKETPLPEITEDEIPFELPEGWVWERLNNISSINGGFAFKSSKYVEDGVRVIRISDFDENGLKDDKIVRYNYSNDLNDYRLEERNILMAMTGGTVGKTFFVQNLNEEMVVNQRVATIKLIKPILENYVNCVIQSSLIKDVVEQAKNSTNDNISMSDIKNFFIPIPPLEEQKAIVEIVDGLLKEVEALEAATKERIQLKEDFVTSALQRLVNVENTTNEWQFLAPHFQEFFTEKSTVKKLRESILQLAVQGKLTANWRTAATERSRSGGTAVEPASILLQKIAAEKAELIKKKVIKKEKPLPEISEDEIPYALPESWVWCRLGELATFINGDRGKNYPNKSEYVSKGIAWINTGHINPDGTLSQSRMNYITRDKYNSLRSGKIEEGDLVYCLRGATFGKTAFVTPFTEGAVASSLMIIRSFLPRSAPFIFRFLISPEGKRQLLRFDNGSAQPNLSANNVKLYAFPLPPLEEQKAIVEKVKALMALCDALEQSIDTAEIQVQDLMQSCLREVLGNDFKAKKAYEESDEESDSHRMRMVAEE